MQIQARDRQVLEKLSRYGILSSQQLARICFGSIAHCTVMRRLRLLEKDNLILKKLGLDNGLAVWVLTNKGASIIGAPAPFTCANKNIFQHEVTLSELRLCLENIGLGENWTSEWEMRRRAGSQNYRQKEIPLIPDGIFLAERNGTSEVIACELEISSKSKVRYRKLFKRYTYMQHISVLWYVVSNHSLGKTLMEIWSQTNHYNRQPKLGYSLLSEVLKTQEQAKIYSTNPYPPTLKSYFGLMSFTPLTDAQGGAQDLSIVEAAA